MSGRDEKTLEHDVKETRAQPRVAVLVPAYNPAPAELAKTVESLLNQTRPVEVIVVDDGSSEPVAQLLPKSSRVRHLRREANGGITAALNDGLAAALAEGFEFIGRLDVGDVSYPQRFERQVRHLTDHPDLALLGAYSQVVDPAGRKLHLHGITGGPDAVAIYLLANAPFKHSTFLMRTEAIRRLGGYDRRFDGAEDYELLLRFSRNSRVDCLQDVLIDYVDDPHGISTRRRTRQLRKRLRAQMAHAQPADPRWYAGVGRALATMLIPSRLAKQLSISLWRRDQAGTRFQ